jgi:2-hydroxy-3-oxopropionate reductase
MSGPGKLPTVGFIGLGIMGKPMARNLMRAGYPLVVHNRSQASVVELVGEGARRSNSPREVAASSDLVITMLPDSPDVELVVAGNDGVIEGARDGQLLIAMSTFNPLVSKDLGSRLAAKGCAMLDAPVSGGEEGAIQGILSIMVGGEESDFQRARGLFGVMGKTVTWMGPLGSGGFTKLANQMIVAANLTAIGEALVFGTLAGVDPEKMVRALSGGMAGSRCLELKHEKILAGDFRPGFRIDLHAKDLGLVQRAASALKIPIPTTALVEQIFAAVRRSGGGLEDHSAVIRFFERLGDVEVRREEDSSS